MSNPVGVCILAKHYNSSTERAIDSALSFGLTVYLGLTHDNISACKRNISAFPIIWRDDFANARNQLLEHAKTPFLLWLDSDEELFSFPQFDWSSFEENIFYIRTQFNSPFTPRVHIRMHRNIPQIRWEERIHERLAVHDLRYSARFISSLIIRHHGYEDGNLVLQKHNRNLAIVQKESGALLYSEQLVQARTESAFGKPNFMHWMRCYRMAVSSSDLRTQPSYFGFEPAFLMSIAGYTKPAEQLLEKNPLNIYLQLAVLASVWHYNKRLDAKRLHFLETCLQNGFYDVYENFPRELLGADENKIKTYIQNWIEEWKGTPMQPIIFEETSPYKRVESVDEQSFDDDLLLMHQGTQKVVILNSASAILWQLLDAPTTSLDLASLLCEANPEIQLETHRQSVCAFLQELLHAELIVPI